MDEMSLSNRGYSLQQSLYGAGKRVSAARGHFKSIIELEEN
jgi:hypothetical protein